MRVAFVVLIWIIALPLQAQRSLAVAFEAFPVTETVGVNDFPAVAEYSFSYKSLSGFGFVEVLRREGGEISYITPHEIRYRPITSVPIEPVVRLGKSNAGNFLHVGARVVVTGMPGQVGSATRKAFVFLAATYLRTVDGLPFDHETTIVQVTRPISTAWGNLGLSGFYRIRWDGLVPNFGQEQVMLALKGVPGLSVGIEFELVDFDITPRAGARYQFSF